MRLYHRDMLSLVPTTPIVRYIQSIPEHEDIDNRVQPCISIVPVCYDDLSLLPGLWKKSQFSGVLDRVEELWLCPMPFPDAWEKLALWCLRSESKGEFDWKKWKEVGSNVKHLLS